MTATNKPEPVVEECDVAASDSFDSFMVKCDTCIGSLDDIERKELAEHFAAHRTAAVARREAEIVAWLKEIDDNSPSMSIFIQEVRKLCERIESPGE